MELKEQRERDRELAFEKYFNSNKESSRSIFKLDGIDFLKFDNHKIKFAFTPSEVAEYISKKKKIFCTLNYTNQWYFGNNTIPLNFKEKLYRKYCYSNKYHITDDNVTAVLLDIYSHLRVWCKEHERYRLDKRKVSRNKY